MDLNFNDPVETLALTAQMTQSQKSSLTARTENQQQHPNSVRKTLTQRLWEKQPWSTRPDVRSIAQCQPCAKSTHPKRWPEPPNGTKAVLLREVLGPWLLDCWCLLGLMKGSSKSALPLPEAMLAQPGSMSSRVCFTRKARYNCVRATTVMRRLSTAKAGPLPWEA